MDPSIVLPTSSRHTTHPTPAEVAAESGRPAPAATQSESTTEKLLHKVEGWFDGVFGSKRSSSPSPPTSSHESTSKSKHQRAEDESRHHASLYAAPTTDVGIGSHTSDLVKDQTHTSQPLPTSSTSQPKIITDTRHSDTIIGDQHVTGKVTSGVAVNDAGEQLGAFSTATFIATPASSSSSSSKPADESMPSDISSTLPSDTSSRPHHSTLKDIKDKILHLPDQAPVYTARHEPPDAAKVNPALLQEVIDNKGQVPLAGGEHVDVDQVEHTSVPVGHVIEETPSMTSSNLSTSAPTHTTPVPQSLLSEVKAAHGEVPSAHHVDINKVEQQHQPAGLGHVVEQPSTTAKIVEKIVAMPSSLQQRLTSNEQSSTLPPGRVPHSALSNEVLQDVKSHKGVPEDVHHVDVSKVEHSAVPLGHVQPAPTLTEKFTEKAKAKYEELTGVAAKPQHEGIPPAALPAETLRDVRMHKGKPENVHHIDVKQVEAEHQSAIPVGHVVGETGSTSLKDKVLDTAVKVVHSLVAQPEPMSHPRIPHAALPNETLKEIHSARGHVPHAHHVDVAKVEKHHLEAQQIELGHEQVPPKPGLMETLKTISGKISYAVNEIATGANQPIKQHAGIPHSALPEETLKDIKRHHGHPEHEQHVDTSLVEHRVPELGHVQPGPSLLEKAVHTIKSATQPAPIQHHENIDHSSLPDQVLMDVKKAGGAKALPTAGGEHIYIQNVEHNAQPAELGHVVEQPKPSLTERAMVGMQQLTNVKNMVKDTIVNATIPAPLPPREDIPESALTKETLREIKVQKGHPVNEQHVPVIEHQPVPLGHVVEGAPADTLITQDVSTPTESKPSLTERLANVKNMVKDTIINATIPAALPPREDIPEAALPKETLREIKIQKGHPVNEQHVEVIEHQSVPVGHVVEGAPAETLTTQDVSSESKPSLTERATQSLANVKNMVKDTIVNATIPAALPPREDIPEAALPKETLREIKIQKGHPVNEQHIETIEHQFAPVGHVVPTTTKETLASKLTHAKEVVIATLTTPFEGKTATSSSSLLASSGFPKEVLAELKSFDRSRLYHVDMAQVEGRPRGYFLGQVTNKPATPIHFPHSALGKRGLWEIRTYGRGQMKHVDLGEAERRGIASLQLGRITDRRPELKRQAELPLETRDARNDALSNQASQPLLSSNMAPELLTTSQQPMAVPHTALKTTSQLPDNTSQPTGVVTWTNKPNMSSHITPVREAAPVSIPQGSSNVAPMSSQPTSDIAWMNRTQGSAMPSASSAAPTSSAPMPSMSSSAPMTASSVPLASAAQDLPIKTTHTSNVPMTSHATGAPMTSVSEAKEAPITSHNVMSSSTTMPSSSHKPLSATHNAGVMTLPHSQKSLEMPSGTSSPASRSRNLPRDEVFTQGRSPLSQQRHLDSPSQTSRSISPSRKAHEVLPIVGNKPITATDLPSLLRKLPTQAVPLVGGVTTGTTMGPAYEMPAVAPVTTNIPTNTTEEKALAPALAIQQGLAQHEKDQAATKDAKKHKDTTSPTKSTTPPLVKSVAQTQGYPASHGNMMPLRSDVPSHHVDDSLPAPSAKFTTNSAPQASRTLSSDVPTRPREQTYDQVERAGMIHHERHEPIINPEQGSRVASAVNNTHQASDANIGRIALPSQDQSHTVAETMPLSTTHVDPFIQQTQSKLLLQSGPQGLDNPIVKQELAHLHETGVSQTIIDIPESTQSSVGTEMPPIKHAIQDKPATNPSCGDHHRSPSPANPLDINSATTSLSAIPTSHLIHDNVEPIARLQKERLHAELKRKTSIPTSIMIPTRHLHQQHQAGYVSPLPITDDTEKQLSSPLPQPEHTAVAADTEFTLTSPAFAMPTQTPKNNLSTSASASASATTLPLTSSNLAQHDRILPPIEHPTGPSSPETINTTSIPAYQP